MGQGFKNKPSTEQAKPEKFSKKADKMWELTWLHVHIFHDNSTGVQQQKSLKISNKNMLTANKTSHLDKNCNDLLN